MIIGSASTEGDALERVLTEAGGELLRLTTEAHLLVGTALVLAPAPREERDADATGRAFAGSECLGTEGGGLSQSGSACGERTGVHDGSFGVWWCRSGSGTAGRPNRGGAIRGRSGGARRTDQRGAHEGEADPTRRTAPRRRCARAMQRVSLPASGSDAITAIGRWMLRREPLVSPGRAAPKGGRRRSGADARVVVTLDQQAAYERRIPVCGSVRVCFVMGSTPFAFRWSGPRQTLAGISPPAQGDHRVSFERNEVAEAAGCVRA